MWQKNQESSNLWYVFPLLNQGVWKKEQCRACKNLVRILDSMQTLISNCLFGNVFISMLPPNSEIAEHCGLTNARLRIHFGVQIPKEQKSCFMLVGKEVIINILFFLKLNIFFLKN